MKIYKQLDQSEIKDVLFIPSSLALPECPAQAEDICFEIDPDISLTCRFFFSAKDAPTLLYYYAGNESISSVTEIAEGYNASGVNVLLISMRGYDGNPGSPSFTTMISDAQTLFSPIAEWLTNQECSSALFVLGRSIGSVVAMETVLNNAEKIKGLIIESGINGTESFLKALGVDPGLLNFSEEEGFNTIDKIEQIKIPTMILHGAKDALVPIDQAENLQSSCGAKSKQFFVIPGAGRDNLVQTAGPLYYQTMKKFFDTVCGVNTWRGQRKKFKKK